MLEDDPVMSRCPVCLARVYVGSGNPCPPHKPDLDSGADPTPSGDDMCPGTGQPTL